MNHWPPRMYIQYHPVIYCSMLWLWKFSIPCLIPVRASIEVIFHCLWLERHSCGAVLWSWIDPARSCSQFKPPVAMDQFVFVHFHNQKLRNHSWGTTKCRHYPPRGISSTMELPYQNSSGAAVGTPKPVKGRVLDCGSQPQSQGISWSRDSIRKTWRIFSWYQYVPYMIIPIIPHTLLLGYFGIYIDIWIVWVTF